MNNFIQPVINLEMTSNVMTCINSLNNLNDNASSYAVLQHGFNNVDHGVKLHHVHHHMHHSHRHRH